MAKSIITGTGSYIPKIAITNDDLSKTLDTSDEWIQTRTGIKKRHLVDKAAGEATAAMATKASQLALKAAGISPDQIDLIILSTVTPDFPMPAAACLVQANLNAKNAAAFDLSAACAGSLYALSIGDSFIKNKTYKKILIIAAETMSSIINWQDRNTAVLFGDGASAAVLEPSNNDRGFMQIDLYADGSHFETIYIKAGGSKKALDEKSLGLKENKVVMNGRETFKFAVRSLVTAIEKILHDQGLSQKDIAFVVPHQANLRIIEAIADKIDLPMDRFLINLDRYANTSTASLLMCFDEGIRNQLFRSGDLILMLGIGAGFAYSAGLYRF